MTDTRFFTTKDHALRAATMRAGMIREDWTVRIVHQDKVPAYNLLAYQQYLVPAGVKLAAYVVEAIGEVAAPGEPPRFVARVIHTFAYPVDANQC